MPKIENVSYADVLKGAYRNNPENTILIQIGDVGSHTEHPTPPQPFAQVYQFTFADISEETAASAPVVINHEQTAQIATILQTAQRLNMDVTVHCIAGLSRSGAVAEVGEMLGFEYIGRTKIPNVLVKGKLLRYFGWYGDLVN